MSLLQPKNSLILSKNHYGVPQDHHYSHKLNTILFPLLSLQTVYIKIPQKKWPASPLLQSYLNRQRSMIPSLLVWRTSKMFCSKRHLNFGRLVRRRCLPNSQRAPALKSIVIRKHIPWSKWLPYGENRNILLWQLPARVWSRKYVCWEWNIRSRSCSISFVWRALRTWQKRHDDASGDIAAASVPRISTVQPRPYARLAAYRGAPDSAHQCCSKWKCRVEVLWSQGERPDSLRWWL